MNKNFVLSLSSTILLALPSIVFGATPLVTFPGMPLIVNPVDFYQLVLNTASLVLNSTWIVAVAFSIVAFILAGFKFLTAQGDPNKVQEAIRAVIWGTGGVLVILLSFTILLVMKVTLGV